MALMHLPLLLRAAALASSLLASPTHAQEAPICMAAILAGKEHHTRIVVEVAHTPEQRAQGLMGRTHLAPHHGMLFVFEEAARWPFWMHNTPLPLDIVPLDEEGRVLGHMAGTPYSQTLTPLPVPARRVLELPAGTLEALGALPPHGAIVLVGGAQCPSRR